MRWQATGLKGARPSQHFLAWHFPHCSLLLCEMGLHAESRQLEGAWCAGSALSTWRRRETVPLLFLPRRGPRTHPRTHPGLRWNTPPHPTAAIPQGASSVGSLALVIFYSFV